jgi:hypothetical protein
MGLNYKSLDSLTRQKMSEEFNHDLQANNLYLSKRFNQNGRDYYQRIMPNHIQNGNDDSLAEDLRNNNSFLTHEDRKTVKGVTKVKVPETAAQTFAEGEFNRFYLRGLCLRAISEGKKIIIYRGRLSENPRSESEAMIGIYLDPNTLLADLRANTGVDTALGLPPGPNSGLTAELLD